MQNFGDPFQIKQIHTWLLCELCIFLTIFFLGGWGGLYQVIKHCTSRVLCQLSGSLQMHIDSTQNFNFNSHREHFPQHSVSLYLFIYAFKQDLIAKKCLWKQCLSNNFYVNLFEHITPFRVIKFNMIYRSYEHCLFCDLHLNVYLFECFNMN